VKNIAYWINGQQVTQSKKIKKEMLVSQILDNFDIDEKSLCSYVKDGF